MGSKRQQRRQKKLAKKKKKRQARSRPGRDRTNAPDGGADPQRGLAWPVGPCFLSDNWHEQGSTVDVVITRVAEAGEAVAGVFVVDLHTDGVRDGTLRGGLDASQLPSLAAQASERSGRAMVDIAPSQAAAVLAAGASLGVSADSRSAMAIADGLEPDDAPIAIHTGEPEAPPPPKEEGWFSRLIGKLVGSP